MARARSNRPDDVASLKRTLSERDALLAEKDALLAERERAIAEKVALIDERDRVIAVREAELYAKTLQIDHLKAQLAVLRRARFGRSSEKLDREIEQLEFLLGELEEGTAESAKCAARVHVIKFAAHMRPTCHLDQPRHSECVINVIETVEPGIAIGMQIATA